MSRMPPDALFERQSLHRTEHRFANLVWEEIAETMENPTLSDIEEEPNAIERALRGVPA